MRPAACRGGPRAAPPGPSGVVHASGARRSWPSTTHGAPPKRASASSSPGSFSPCAGAVQRRRRRWRRARAARRTPGRSGRRERVIDSQALQRPAGSSRGQLAATLGAAPSSRCHQHVAAPGRRRRRAPRAATHRVDAARARRGSRRSARPGERLAVERLVDPRPEEADQRARLGDGDVPERAPGGDHAAGGGVAQVDEVGQAGLPCAPRRPRVILTICRKAAVPSCMRVPPDAGAASSGSPSRGGPLDGGDEPLGRGARRSTRPGSRTRRRPRRPGGRAGCPRPVMTDSSVPAFVRGRRQLGGVGAAGLGRAAAGERPSDCQLTRRRGPRSSSSRASDPVGRCVLTACASRRLVASVGVEPGADRRRRASPSSRGGGVVASRGLARRARRRRRTAAAGRAARSRPSVACSTSMSRPWERVWSQP